MDEKCTIHIIRGPLSCVVCQAHLEEFDCVFIIDGVEECEDLVSAVGPRDVMLLRCSDCNSIFHFIAGCEFDNSSRTIH